MMDRPAFIRALAAVPRSVNLSTLTEIRLDGMAHVREVAA